MLSCMSDQEGDDDKIKRRMDKMLRRLLTTPPQSRAKVAEVARRATEKPRRGRPPKIRKPA